MSISDKSQQWLFEQTPELIAFFFGVAATYLFVSLVFRNRIKSLEDNIEYLRQQLSVSDQRCDARVNAIETRYQSELDAIRQINEASERRILVMMKMIGDIKGDIAKGKD